MQHRMGQKHALECPFGHLIAAISCLLGLLNFSTQAQQPASETAACLLNDGLLPTCAMRTQLDPCYGLSNAGDAIPSAACAHAGTSSSL